MNSARVFCITSYTTKNATLYTLIAVEWSHNTTCPTDHPIVKLLGVWGLMLRQ